MQCGLCDATVDVAGDNQYYCPRCQAMRGPELVYPSRAEKAALAAAQAEATRQPETEAPESTPEMADILEPLPPPVAKPSVPPPILPAEMSMLAKAELHKPQPASDKESVAWIYFVVILTVDIILLIAGFSDPDFAALGVYCTIAPLLRFTAAKQRKMPMLLTLLALLLLFIFECAFATILS